MHSGLVLARGQDVVAALRRITAFPAGLSLTRLSCARAVHAEAADRRSEAATQREVEVAERREREATAQQESTAAARWKAPQPLNERLRKRGQNRAAVPAPVRGGRHASLAVLGPAGDARWLDAYQATSSSTEEQYRLEASYWVMPLPRDGLLTLVCAWPEIKLPEAPTDIVLPDLAVRAAGAQALDVAEEF